MKSKRRPLFVVSSLPLAICLAFGPIANGALFWDGATTGGTGDGASAGGSGTWSTSVQNWDAGNGIARVVWTNGNDAVFAGSAGTVTLGTAISAGNISISNNNYTIATDSGALTLSGGITTGGSFYHQIAGAGGLVLSGSQALNITGGLRISTPVSGSGTITKTGAGFFSFSNSSNTFAGKIIVNQGSFGINGDSALGAVPGSFVADSITLNGGTLVDGIVNGSGGGFDNGGEVTLNANRGVTLGGSGGTVQVGYDPGTLFAISGNITGSGSLTKTDSGTLMLYGASNYSGGTFVNGGVLSVGRVRNDGNNGTNTGLGTGVVEVANGAQLVLAGNDLTIANNIILKGNATQETRQGALVGGRQDGSSANVLTGTLTLDGTGDRGISTWWSDKSLELRGKVTGAGNLRVMNVKADGSNGASVVILSNNTNDYSGDTIVDGIGSGAILRLGASNVISDGAGKGNVTINGRLELNTFTETINGLSGSGTVSSGSGSSLIAGNNNATSTFSGVMDGVGAFTKAGSGVLTLSGASTFTGAVIVNGGTLIVAKSGADNGSTGALGLGNAGKSITVNAGATLTGTLNNWFGNQSNVGTLSAITVNGGTLSTSRYSTIGVLTLNGATVTNASTDTNPDYQAFAFRGNVTVGGSSASTISANAATATTQGYHLGSNTTFNVADATGNANADLTISAPLRNQSGDFGSAAGALTKSGAGTLALSGANTFTGGTTISAGAIAVGEPGSSGANGTNSSLGSGSVNVASGAQLILAGKNLNIANNVTLNGTATVNGLQGALVGGRQDESNNNTLSGTLTLAGAGDRTVSTWWSDKTLTLSGKVGGTGNLRIVNATNGGNGGSIVILSNATNDYSGSTIVDGGGNGSTQTLRLGADNVIPDGASKGNLFIEGRLELNGFNETVNGLSTGGGVISLSSGNTLTVGNNNAAGDSFVVLTGLGNLTKIGNGTQILRGTSDFSGTTTISGGTLQVSVNGTTASLGSGAIVNNATLAFQRQNEITVSNAISGTGAVSQIGTGTLVLAGTNKTYTGATSVNAGTLNLTGSLANSAISVASGARFSPTVTTSAGLSSGSAGASLTLNSGGIFDMTSTNAGTINTFTLNPGSNTFSGQALSLAGANLRFDLGGGSADRLSVNSGTAIVSGTNNLRFNTGSSLTAGTYTLISAASGLTGNFQFDGGSTLTVPAQQQIKKVGNDYYRLTLQNSGTAQQVFVTAAPTNLINIMPLGSSITEGLSSEGASYSGGGYRSQLYQSLVNDGRFTPHFVGSSTSLNAGSSGGYNVLSGANELNHEGHSGYTTSQILKNLNANGGDGGNNGGLWLASGNGVTPDYVTLSIGGNDYGADGSETTAPLMRTDAIVSQIQSLRPDAHVIVSNLFYRTQTSGGNVVGDLQNTYYNPGVQGMVFNHVLAGQHVSYYDAYSAVTPGGSMSTINDGIHPTTVGYNAFADGWYDALANGSAFWTGSSGGAWNNQANFAQNYQLTTARQTAPGASTDVHFNSNASSLGTTLGQNTSVRSVNFAAGATGAVTLGGANTLTLGAGGITVQAGTGAHTISSNVVLGAAQSWGNVSSNPLTVTGDISGSGNLSLVGSYSVQLAGTLVGSTYTTTTQTVSGTGGFVLNGANSHSGGTTINGVTVSIGHNTALGSGTVAMNDGATLANDSAGALTVGNGFTLSGPTIGVTFTGSQNLNLNGALNYSAGMKVTKTGASVLTISSDNGGAGASVIWNVTGGDYNGSTGLYDNVLAINSGRALGNATNSGLNLDGGTLRFTTDGGTGYFSSRTINVLAGGGAIDDGGFAFGEATLGGGVVNPGISITSGATLSLISSNQLVLSGVLSDNGAVTKFGSGTATLKGASTYTGATTINSGTLVVGTAGANDGSTGALGSGNTGKAITVNAGATLTGTASNWFGNQANVGTLSTITLNGGTLSTSRYTTIGTLTLNGATVTNAATDTGNYQAFAFLGNVAVGGSSASTISANAATGTTQGYHLGSNTSFNVTDATGNSNADLIVSAPLRDQSGDFGNAAGGLTKSGIGTLFLSGANTYTGATAVSAGTLTVTGSIANSAVTVSNGGTTIASGTTGTLGSTLTVNSGAILAAGGVAAAGTATVTGATTLNNSSIFSWDISGNGTGYDKLVTASLAGDASPGDAIFRIVAADSSFSDTFWNQTRTWTDIFTTNGMDAVSNWAGLFTVSLVDSGLQTISPVNGSFSVSGSTLTWSAVPEVSNLLVGGLLGLGFLRRRRRPERAA